MIVLDDQTSLVIVPVSVGSAATHWEASGVLVTPTADTPTAGLGVMTLSEQTMMAAAPSGQHKVVKNINLRSESNAPGVGAVNIRVSKKVGTAEYPLASCLLKPGQALTYASGQGWVKLDADGTPLTKVDSPNFAPSVSRGSYNHARASIATLVAGSDVSFWRGTGVPAQGAIPAAAAVCHAGTAGALPLRSRTGTQKRRLMEVAVQAATASQTLFLEDRLAHMGGLNGTVATAQNIGIDLQTLAGNNNLAARKGAADYSDVDWFMEWYTATGATAVTPVINVTYDDGSTGNCNVWVLGATALPASVAASRRYQLIPAAAGRQIRGLNTVTMPTTGTAGNFGFAAVRKLASLVTPAIAYREEVVKFDKASAPVLEDEACLTFAGTMTATSSGIFTGRVTQDVSEA